MNVYLIEKGNLLKARKVFRRGSTIELTDDEAAAFRASGGVLSEIPVTATDVEEKPEMPATGSPEMEEAGGNDVVEEGAAPPEEGEKTKSRRRR